MLGEAVPPPTLLRLLRLLSARPPSRRPSGWSGTVSRSMPSPLRRGRPPPPVLLLLGLRPVDLPGSRPLRPLRTPALRRAAPADGLCRHWGPPLLFEGRFVDRAALPKDVSFGPAVVPTVIIDGDSPRGRDHFEADAGMHGDGRYAEELAGSYHDDDDAVGGGPSTPVWPPADATLAQLEKWLDSFRRLPEDEGILARQDLLSRRIRMPMPAPPASPFTFVLRAKRATDKRRRQLHRFIAMRDGFLAQERALQASIVDAHATITATQRLFTLAEDEEYERFRSYASSLDAPGRIPSPEVAGATSADDARQAGHDPGAAAGVSGIITQLLMLFTAAEAFNLESAYAAVLEQARLVHQALTGDRGPTLAPVPPSPGRVAEGGGGVAPCMAWVLGSAGLDPPGMPMPPSVAAAHAAAVPPSATGSPASHGGYAGVVSGGLAPTPAESAGREARVRSASRSLKRPRPKAASPAAGSRAEERERSPRGQSALAAALAAEVAVAEAERHVSTDDYMPDAGGDEPAKTMPGLPLPRTRVRRASAARVPLVSCGSRSPRQRHSCAWPSMCMALPLAWMPPGLMLLWTLRWRAPASLL